MAAESARIDPYVLLHLRTAADQTPPPSGGEFVSAVTSDKIDAITSIKGLSLTNTPLRSGEVEMVAFHADADAQDTLFRMPGVGRLVATTRSKAVPVLLHLRDPSWNRDIEGLSQGARLGTVLTATVTASALAQLANDPAILSVEASRGGIADCVHSMPFIGASAVHQPPVSERGGGAFMAMIDEGIDVLHQAFQDSASHSRIRWLWDQSDPTGPAPSAVDAAFKDQAYGTLHTRADLDRFIAAGAVGKRLGRDPGGHGTHVASIAAGSPVAASGFPGGVAPEADLICVLPMLGAGPSDPNSLGYSRTHVDALAFIRAAALRDGMPVAVNVSLGQNAGAHDGSSLLELAFDAFSGGGREPGFVIVKSAGNEFGFAGHAFAQAFQGGVVPIEWTTDPKMRFEDYLEFWFGASDDLHFTLIAPATTPPGLSCTADNTAPDGTAVDPTSGLSLHMLLTRFHPDNGDSRLQIVVQNQTGGGIDVGGRWRLEILGRTVLSAGFVHGWVERDDARAVHFVTGSADDLTLSIPATARTVVSVGACMSQDPLSLYDNSSRGPTRDDRQKPELVAPGVAISAARSGTLDQLTAMSGTSMAAPHVTGAVALALARRRRLGQEQLNAMQIRAGLVQSASRFTGRWQPGFGNGRVDVEQFLALFA